MDTQHARDVLPYALMSRAAYDSGRKHDSPAVGYTYEADWQTVFAKTGTSRETIKSYEDAGFSANIYKNNATGEIVVAYRGSEGNPLDNQSPDWSTNRRAKTVANPADRLETQYVAAASLAKRTKDLYGSNIVLTGHSLAGGEASYAGSWGDYKVVTFNAARNGYSSRGGNANQLNIIVPGDPIGDPNAKLSGVVGSGSLPGKYYSIDTSSDTSGLGGKIDRHKIDGIIGGLSDKAR